MKFKFALLLSVAFLFSSCASVKSWVDKVAQVKEREATHTKTTKLTMAWNKAFDPPYESGNLPIYYQSPLIYKGLLMVGTPKGDFFSYVLESGRVHWKVHEGVAITSRALVSKDRVFYGRLDGRVVARDAYSGKLLYQLDLGQTVMGSPVAYQGKLYVQLVNHSLVALDESTGKILWKYKRSVSQKMTLRGVSTPVFWKDKIIFGAPEGYLVALGQSDGTLKWELKVSSGDKFSDVDLPLAMTQEGLLLVSSYDGMAFFVDAKRGSIAQKIDDLRLLKGVALKKKDAGVRDNSLPFLAGDTQGQIVSFNPDFSVRTRKSLTDNKDIGAISRLALWDDLWVVLNAKGMLYIYGDQGDKLLKKWHLGHSYSQVYGDLVVDENYLAFYSSRNRLYVMRRY